ncbi:MAG: hypothetical protein JO027_09195 [Solirubrobacterales bacterium]|nr:hypothetical protein [Solirubrobacterales bacterium]
MRKRRWGGERLRAFTTTTLAAVIAGAFGWCVDAHAATVARVPVAAVSGTQSVVAYPQLATNASGDVTAVWQQSLASSSTVIEAAQRPARAAAWGSPQTISASGVLQDGLAADGEFPAIAATSRGAAVVVWEDNGEIAAAERAGPLDQWSPPVRISSSGVDPEPPGVAITGPHSAMAIWTGQLPSGRSVVQVARVDLTRRRWGAPHTLEASRSLLTGAAIAASPGRAIVGVWKRALRGSVLGARTVQSEVQAASWSSASERTPQIKDVGAETDLSSQADASTESAQPQVGIVGGDGAIVVWQSGAGSDTRIATAVQLVPGREWHRAATLGEGGSLYPALAVSRTSATIAWQSGAGGIWACTTSLLSRGCTTPHRLTARSDISGPVISAAEDGATVVAWTQGNGAVWAAGGAKGALGRWATPVKLATRRGATPAVVLADDHWADVAWARSDPPRGSVPAANIEAAAVRVPTTRQPPR